MTAADVPLPPEVFYDEAPPLSDGDIDRLFDAAELLVDPPEGMSAYRSVEDAIQGLAEGPDAPSYPKAQETARWRIEDDRTAAWAASKLAAVERTVTDLVVQRAEWERRIGAWFDQAARKPRRTADFMRGQLEAYGLRRREETGEKSLVLPDATVKTRESKPQVEVADDEVLARWLDDNWLLVADETVDRDEVVRRSVKVMVGEFRKLVSVDVKVDGETGEVLGHRAVTANGTAVPGTQVRPGGITASVETR